jgi:ABC-2 type transport system permease protein
MTKIWKVFRYEYSRHVLRKRFIFAVLSIPIFLVVIMAIPLFASVLQADSRPVGYVDHPGLLAHPAVLPPPDDPFSQSVDFIALPDESHAQAALEADDIQAYYILSPEYFQTGQARLIYNQEPHQSIQSRFAELVRLTLLADQPPEIVQRLAQGSLVTVQSADGSRQMTESDWYNILVPILTGILFFIVIMTSGGYLLQAVIEEKENRTMEIIVTSVSPGQLMAGKILGNLSVGLTQLLLWVGFILVGILIGRNYFDWIDRIQFGWDFIGLMLVALLPAFIMIAALMAALGATVTEAREAQQISGLFVLPLMVPYWFSFQIITNPNGPLAVGLSFFPLTAPATLTLRAGFTQIPTLQLVLNIALLVVAAGGAIWLAARTFRLGMLSYGKRLSLRQIFGRHG